MSQKGFSPILIVLIVGVILAAALGGGYLLSKSSTSSSNSTQISSEPEDSMISDEDVVSTATDPKKGDYLTDKDDNTLYTYDKDKKDESSCHDDCAKTWKPYTENAKPKPEKTKPEENVTVKPTHVEVKPVKIKVTPAPIHIKTKHISVITRPDKTHQYSYKGHALYHYSGDKKPKDITGDGVDGAWHVAQP